MDSQINKDFKDDPSSLIQRYLDLKNKSNSNNVLCGKIVDNNDPDKFGRCRIMVYGQYEGIPNDDLPWAVPDFDLMGRFGVPSVGDIVNVYFRDNDKFCPHYTTKVIERIALSDERDEDYPNTFILYETPEGSFHKVNRKTSEETIRTASGTIITVTANGNTDIDTTHTTTGNINITARGDITIDATGTVNIYSDVNINANAPIITTPPGTVAPSGTGLMNALPVDPLTGLLHSGNIFFRT